MRLSFYAQRIVADLRVALPGLDIAEHAGRFDLSELWRYGLCVPLIRVSLMGIPVIEERTHPAFVCQFEASIVTRRDAHDDASRHSQFLVDALLLVLHNDVLASDLGSRPTSLSAENLYDRVLSLAGVHFWRVSWRQTLEPDAESASAALASFEQLAATYTPPGGAPVVATDTVLIPQE